jgi:orotidine-5'-phosphate decarboxylase
LQSRSVSATANKQIALGPYIAIFKTHIDIVLDFDSTTVDGLQTLAKKHNFLFFEDRKFVDIGNTIKIQYDGALRIAQWAHFVNACVLAGDGTIRGLSETVRTIGLKDDRGLLLLAEMSTEGSLATGTWTKRCIELAQKYPDSVVGFVSNSRLTLPEDVGGKDFVTFTTGVNRSVRGDNLGQQYQTPAEAIRGGSDIVIVGRGIYEAPDPIEMAKCYQKEAWSAYESML